MTLLATVMVWPGVGGRGLCPIIRTFSVSWNTLGERWWVPNQGNAIEMEDVNPHARAINEQREENPWKRLRASSQRSWTGMGRVAPGPPRSSRACAWRVAVVTQGAACSERWEPKQTAVGWVRRKKREKLSNLGVSRWWWGNLRETEGSEEFCSGKSYRSKRRSKTWAKYHPALHFYGWKHIRTWQWVSLS